MNLYTVLFIRKRENEVFIFTYLREINTLIKEYIQEVREKKSFSKKYHLYNENKKEKLFNNSITYI